MRLEQRLPSGLIIEQDLAASVRQPLFATGNPEFPHWTNGGTAFFVQFERRIFGVTCRHILGNRDTAAEWHSLRIPNTKAGPYCLPVIQVFTASEGWGHVAESDVLDIAVVEVARSELIDAPYYLSETTVCRSSHNDSLIAHGTVKERTDLAGEFANICYCHLGLVDVGRYRPDPSLRIAIAEYSPALPYSDLAGLSGAPVQNLTKNALCGIVTRGRLVRGRRLVAYYMDVSHVLKLVRSASTGGGVVRYLQNDPSFAEYQASAT